MDLGSFFSASWPAPAPWREALAALGAALAWAALFRSTGRRDLAALGAGVGLAVGWALTLGVSLASPRQLAERLPLLALASTAAALPLCLLAARRPAAAAIGAGLVLAAGAWWLAGAPATAADLRRALVPVLALGAASALASLELRSPLRTAAAFAFLLAAMGLLRPPGPWSALAVAGVGAALGALPASAGAPATAAASLPAALALAGLAAGPILARGAAPDWTASAAPFAALVIGPALAARFRGGAGAAAQVAGWTAAGGVALLFTWLLAAKP